MKKKTLLIEENTPSPEEFILKQNKKQTYRKQPNKKQTNKKVILKTNKKTKKTKKNIKPLILESSSTENI